MMSRANFFLFVALGDAQRLSGLAQALEHVARSGEGVGPVRGFLGWAGLRLGGWVAYRQHARARRERGGVGEE